jgi:hypothetical protein
VLRRRHALKAGRSASLLTLWGWSRNRQCMWLGETLDGDCGDAGGAAALSYHVRSHPNYDIELVHMRLFSRRWGCLLLTLHGTRVPNTVRYNDVDELKM